MNARNTSASVSKLVLTAAALLAGCSSEARDLGESEEAILGGALDTNNTFDVGVCTGPLVTDATVGPVGTCRTGAVKCSGTLIGPNLVLTARHCVHTAEPNVGAATPPLFCEQHFTETAFREGGTRVTTSSSLFVGSPKWYDVDKILFPATNSFCDDDIALLILAKPVPYAEARYAGVDFSRDIAKHPPKEVALVGRGVVTEEFSVDPVTLDVTGTANVDRGDLQRRVAEHVPFKCASNKAGKCTVADHSVLTTHSYTLTTGQFLVGPGGGSGDSGSAVFDQKKFDKKFPRVLGVYAWGTIGPDGKSNAGGAVRVDRHRDFIIDGAIEAAWYGLVTKPWWLADADGTKN